MVIFGAGLAAFTLHSAVAFCPSFTMFGVSENVINGGTRIGKIQLDTYATVEKHSGNHHFINSCNSTSSLKLLKYMNKIITWFKTTRTVQIQK